MRGRTTRNQQLHVRRCSRRAFVRQAGRLVLAVSGGIGLLASVTRAAYAGPLAQADEVEQVTPATPSATPATGAPTPAATEAASPTSTLTPATTPTIAPTAEGAAPATASPTPTATPMQAAPVTTPSPSATDRATPTGPPLPANFGREMVLTTLRLQHPRLLLLADDDARIRTAVSSDTTARSYRDALLRNGSRLLTQPTPERALIGPSLLTVSRTVLERVMTLALLYRLDRDPRWAARARAELLAAAGFSDWNPGQFLDVAELCHAFAIGYDWLYDALTADDRLMLRRALIDKGLRPAELAYQAGAPWTRLPTTDNLVGNGGVALAALAIADEEPGIAGTLLANALQALPRAIGAYAPAGAWIEGASAWEYGTLYLATTLAALTSALGTDFGLGEAPGLAETGRFRLQLAGPTGQFFNYADARPRVGDSPVLFWLARRYDQPALALAAREAAVGRASARDLLWYDGRGGPADIAALPLDARYPRTNLVVLRSAWNDKDAIYVGFKGGDNAAVGAHLDLGTFVLDAFGQRWAVELGPDDETLPGYDGPERWTYERLKSSGQNTLLIDGAGQDPRALAPLSAFQSGGDGGLAVADLSEAYLAAGAARVQRGISLRDARSRVLLQDEIETTAPVDVTWTMHTNAAVEIRGDRALLSQGGVLLEARLLSPPGATFTVEDVEIEPPQQPAIDLRRLVARLTGVTTTQLVVLFTPRRSIAATPTVPGLPGAAGALTTPASTESLPPPEIVPLSRWAVASAPWELTPT